MKKIKTDRPVTQDRSTMTHKIAEFWDKTSRAWQTIWGSHIHHGYFESHRETPVEAQEKLMEKLAALLGISPQDEILDVGCGMGGCSLYLAQKYRATVTGITLSHIQVDLANESARREEVENVCFKVEDALSLAGFQENSFDVVWSLESCEQFYDKDLFILQAFRVLKPGGKLMLATWCSGADEYEGLQARKYRELCISLQLPYMPTIPHYVQLIQQQGLVVRQSLDWTANVKETWRVGMKSLRAYSLFKVFLMSGWRGLLFKKQALMMQEGFDEGRIKYGVVLASKPYVQRGGNAVSAVSRVESVDRR